MNLKFLNQKLENIEHAYFCKEKNCPVCGGFYIENFEKNPIKIDIPSEINEHLYIDNDAKPGEIWYLNVASQYPIYVLIIKDYGYFKRCVRVSEFIEFKGKFDLVFENWLIECWNSFPVLNFRLKKKIKTLESDLFKKVLDLHSTYEKTEEINEHYLIERFKEIEVKFQNDAFLNNDEEILLNLHDEIEGKIIKIDEINKNLSQKVIQLEDINEKNFKSIPLAASDKDFYRYGIEDAEVLIENSEIVVLTNFLKIQEKKVIRLYFELFLELSPYDIEIYLNNRKINYELLYKDMENIYLDIPFEKGNYTVIIKFFNDFNLKFKLNFC